MDLDIRHNIADVLGDLTASHARHLPFAISVALNETGADLIEANKAHMAEVFDRPTRWTLNAFHFRRATKQRQFITIERKTPARGRHYLEVQAEGGKRPLTGWEKQIGQRLPYSGNVGYIAAPGVRRDGFGNIHRGEMQRILSRIGAQTDAASNSTKASRKRAKGGGAYFVAKPGSRLRPGVYLREGQDLTRVLAFDTAAPTYKARYRFDAIMLQKASAILPDRLAAAFARALATAR